MVPRALLIAALALPACGPAPAPAPPPAPAKPQVDEAAMRRAVDVALTSLAKRNFEVAECSAAEARTVSEAEAKAGAPVGERCTILIAQRADRTWILGIRPATTATPSRAGGSVAVVTVTPGGEGVTHIDYAR